LLSSLLSFLSLPPAHFAFLAFIFIPGRS
jgi:hypothetical protein